MNISLTLECKGGTDIESNGEHEEEKLLLASTGNENFDCSDKGNPISTLRP